MAAPPELTIKNLSGTWVMNKDDSDDPDEILRLQGVSWVKRKIISSITVTLYTKHYVADDGLEHIDIQQVGSGGFKGNFEPRVLDWTDREHNDGLFGQVVGRSRHLKIGEVEDEWQREGWSDDTVEHGAIQSFVRSDTSKSHTTWTADQIWGFMVKDGLRKHVRKVHFTGPGGEDLRKLLVYDYQGSKTEPT